MKITKDNINTKEKSREFAIEWQRWQAKKSMSYDEVLKWQEFFIKLGKKFNLTKEFKENGII